MERITKEDIISAAKEAGLPKGWYQQYGGEIPECLDQFAYLIAQKSDLYFIRALEKVKAQEWTPIKIVYNGR